ncbi:MAG: glutamine--fructose-6-phosphate transaminase (isomerizing) [Candidatus Aramenus sp.]|nr:glutamine--fructose-6-phosphate transaminase (isomerizing) [Candidatus Aramenus sp.]
MCGIIGILSKDPSLPLATITYECLTRLEYRGYDSVGVAALGEKGIEVRKAKGSVEEFAKKYNVFNMRGEVFLGHTRWATHGQPTDYNAHPHLDCSGSIAVIHNGTIRNFVELKEELISLGHKFKSETDTEVIPHLVEEFKKRGMDTFTAFKAAISSLKGTYAVLAVVKGEKRIYFAKNFNPLVIGLGEKAIFISSDIPSFLPYTKTIVVVQNGDVGYVSENQIYIENNGVAVDVRERVHQVDWDASAASKEGYEHFMLKEIYESPEAVMDTIYGMDNDRTVEEVVKRLEESKRVIVVAAGTSYHAGLYFSMLLQRYGYTSISVVASEFYNVKTNPDDTVIAISQSGETLDVILAIRRFKEYGSPVVSLTNVIESAVARESDFKLYTRAGPEIGVAATKTFTSQLGALVYLWAKLVGEKVNLEKVGEVIRGSLNLSGEARKVGEELSKKENAYYLGRGLGVPLAMEGALKIKEIAYIHAEAYPAGESKHGPIALVSKGFPVVFVNTGELFEELQSNVQEMKARGAVTFGISVNRKLNTDREILLSVEDERLNPFAVAPIIQLIAYYASVSRGLNPDRPRNLAKTVTVE